MAALLAFLLMSLINRWQERGIDVKQYFDAVSADTMTVLSGVPSDDLFANPERDPLTGEYPEGEPLRTNPMRLTFDSDTGLELLGVNLVIGGFYGFMLLVVIAGLLGAVITRAAFYVEIGQRRKQLMGQLAGNPLSHWVVLLLPLIFFALLWITIGQGSNDPLAAAWQSGPGNPAADGFRDHFVWAGRAACCTAERRRADVPGAVRDLPGYCSPCLIALGIWRVLDNKAYFVALSDNPDQSRNVSIAGLAGVGGGGRRAKCLCAALAGAF